MDLNDIPEDQQENFPMGVTEHKYATFMEMAAFLNGLQLPDDIDVSNGEPFERDGDFVVRVRVGDWGEED